MRLLKRDCPFPFDCNVGDNDGAVLDDGQVRLEKGAIGMADVRFPFCGPSGLAMSFDFPGDFIMSLNPWPMSTRTLL